MSDPKKVNAFVVSSVVKTQVSHDGKTIAIVLKDAQGELTALALNAATAELLVSAILEGAPQPDNTQFDLDLANDIQEVEQIDRVSVDHHEDHDLPFDVDFQIGQKTRVKLRMSYEEARRWCTILQGKVRDHTKKRSH